MTTNNKKIYTRHTKETCLKAIEEAIEPLSNIRIKKINRERTKLLLCRKGTLRWNKKDTKISITNVLNGLTKIDVAMRYHLAGTGSGFDAAFNIITEGASFTDQTLYANRKQVEQIENTIYIILDAIFSQLEEYPVEYTSVSNIWNYGDSLYQKLKQLDELKQKDIITIDEFVVLQKDLINQVQKE
jgi:hypothetical protein